MSTLENSINETSLFLNDSEVEISKLKNNIKVRD